MSEANVIDVERDEDRFSVTMIHDDDGEDGYADWWQFETTEGERLGRRTLLHGHGSEEFTRSTRIDIGDHGIVIVRAHDQSHGYGGQAAIYNVSAGTVRLKEQGAEPQSLGRNTSEEGGDPGIQDDEDSDQDRVEKKDGSGGDIDQNERKEEGLIAAIIRWLKDLI